MTDRMAAFQNVVRGVLERFAFMFSEPESDECLDHCKGPILHAVITFAGPRQGALSVTATEKFCVELAGNVLGADPSEIDSETGADAMKELANIICGEAIASVFGGKGVFDLTVPTVCRIEGIKWRELLADPDNARFCVEGNPMLASFTLTDDPAR